MKNFIVVSILTIFSITLNAQNVGINTTTPDHSAALDVTSSTKGLLAPRMTTTQRNAITNPAKGLLVFDNDDNQFFFHDGTNWVKISLETDPKVGALDNNFMPKWNGTTLENSTLFQSGANLGVNNVSPRYPLSVGTDFGNNTNNIAAFNTTNNKPIFVGETTNNKGIIIGYSGNDIQGRNTTTTNGDLVLNPFAGNVGIGTDAPQSKLAVNGSVVIGGDYANSIAPTNGLAIQGNLNIGLESNSTDAPLSKIFAYDATQNQMMRLHNASNNGLMIVLNNSPTGVNNSKQWQIESTGLTNPTGHGNLSISNNQGNALMIKDNLNIGIGTTNPTAKLHVNGTTRTTGFQLTGNGAGNGKILQSDASGNALWVNPSIPKVQDSDVNTLIEVEKTPNDDKIRFTLNGTEYFKMNKGAFEILNTGNAVLIGQEAGLQENYAAGTHSVGIGYQALKVSVNGSENVGVGSRALWSLVDGNNNTALGADALRSNNGYNNTGIGSFAGAENASGNGNVFLGYRAGENELGSGKLYIANSNTATPLIYGDFSTKKLTVNDYLQSKYFTLTHGSNNGYVLQSDATGNASWVNPNTVFTETDPKIGSLTTNYLSKWNGTTLANTQIFDNGTNIGIGTTTPNFKLHVNGSMWSNDFATNSIQTDEVNATDAATENLVVGQNAFIEELAVTNKTKTQNFQMTNGAANHYILKSDAVGNASWANPNTLFSNTWTTSDDHQYSVLSGNVGIGTATPAEKLDVNGKTKTTNFQLTTGANNGYVLKSDANGNATWVSPNTIPFTYTETDPKVAAVTTHKIPKWNGTSLVDGAIYDTGTNIGIGVAAPVARLEVNGEIRATVLRAATGMVVDAASANIGTNANTLTFGDASGEGIGSNRDPAAASNYGLDFYTAHLQRMFIDNDGNVGINTITPTATLHVVGNSILEGAVTINNNYDLPINGGSNAQFLQTLGNGTTVWVSLVQGGSANYVTKYNGARLEQSLLYDNGTNVGIGTTNPNQAKFVVNGNTNAFNGNFTYFQNATPTTGTNTTGNAQNYSIYASNRIAASEFNAFSDRRIKRILGGTNSSEDLATLMQINITNYKMIDTVAKGNATHKKVIAQEIAEILPSAVSKMTDFIPNIYKMTTIKNGFIELKNHDLNVGDNLKLIFEDKQTVEKVVKIDESGVYVQTHGSAAIQEGLAGQVFVFGKEVNDFHTVDYEALTTLNISATQELMKQINDLKAQNAVLNNKVQKSEADNKNIKADIELLKAAVFKKIN